MRKLLTVIGIGVMLLLLVISPHMLKKPQKVTISTASDKTPYSSATSGTTNTNTSTPSSNPSYYTVKPVTLPNGTVTTPTYTAPGNSGTSSSSTPTSTIDSSKCAPAKAAIAQIESSYTTQNQQLKQEIQNLQSYITSNSQYYGPGAASPPDTSKEQAQLQTDDAQLINNVSQENSQEAPYQQVLTANACT